MGYIWITFLIVITKGHSLHVGIFTTIEENVLQIYFEYVKALLEYDIF